MDIRPVRITQGVRRSAYEEPVKIVDPDKLAGQLHDNHRVLLNFLKGGDESDTSSCSSDVLTEEESDESHNNDAILGAPVCLYPLPIQKTIQDKHLKAMLEDFEEGSYARTTRWYERLDLVDGQTPEEKKQSAKKEGAKELRKKLGLTDNDKDESKMADEDKDESKMADQDKDESKLTDAEREMIFQQQAKGAVIAAYKKLNAEYGRIRTRRLVDFNGEMFKNI